MTAQAVLPWRVQLCFTFSNTHCMHSLDQGQSINTEWSDLTAIQPEGVFFPDSQYLQY